MLSNPQFSEDLVIFTEEILNGKCDFACSVYCYILSLCRILYNGLHDRYVKVNNLLKSPSLQLLYILEDSFKFFKK